MITEDTVFILGAGASCPYGFPDGKELRREICEYLVNDIDAYFDRYDDVRSRMDRRTFQAKDFITKFKKSNTKSIDLFLSRNPKLMELGKWAIILRILDAERKSKFGLETIDENQDWYSYLYDKLTNEFIVKEDYYHLEDNKVSFITFNYDRSLEYFLWESYFNSFHEIGSKEKYEQIKKLNIIHLFGQISGLEWQDSDTKLEYRIDPYSVVIEKISKNLHILYEETENPKLEEAKKLIENTKRIFFLGFGFAPENINILQIPKILNRNQKIYGTGYGLYPEEIEKRKKSITPEVPDIASFQNRNIHIEKCDCLELLRKYL